MTDWMQLIYGIGLLCAAIGEVLILREQSRLTDDLKYAYFSLKEEARLRIKFDAIAEDKIKFLDKSIIDAHTKINSFLPLYDAVAEEIRLLKNNYNKLASEENENYVGILCFDGLQRLVLRQSLTIAKLEQKLNKLTTKPVKVTKRKK